MRWWTSSGALEGFEQLGVTRVYNRPVAVGSGWVRAAHGVIPVPAPATAILLEGIELGPNGPVTGEATTPTGAVLLRVLSAGAPPARWRPRVGRRLGRRRTEPERVSQRAAADPRRTVAEAGEVVLLSTDLDDLSPEYLDPLREALFAAGALDVQVWATQMKKGRTGFRVEITVAPAEADRVAESLFRHSTTAGVRRQIAERVTLAAQRAAGRCRRTGMRVRVKVLDAPGRPASEAGVR